MRFIFTILSFLIVVSIKVSAQNSLLLGLRDNEYAKIGFFYKRNWFIIAEHSIFITKLKNQVVNGYIGYKNDSDKLRICSYIYGGLHYGRLYKSSGISTEIRYIFIPWFNIYGGIRPHYDTTYRYDTAFKVGISFTIHKTLSIKGEFTNYPEYRLCENRIKTGLDIKVQNLKVSPELSIPIEGKLENIRLLIGFKHKINL